MVFSNLNVFSLNNTSSALPQNTVFSLLHTSTAYKYSRVLKELKICGIANRFESSEVCGRSLATEEIVRSLAFSLINVCSLRRIVRFCAVQKRLLCGHFLQPPTWSACWRCSNGLCSLGSRFRDYLLVSARVSHKDYLM